MLYVTFVGTSGAMPDDAVAEMNQGIPAYRAEMEPRGVQLVGRELDLPDMAATVRVRAGETLVTDGPFAETKEFVGGIHVLECRDLDEAIEVTSKSPVARFLPFEIRPFRSGPRLSRGVQAFKDRDDSAGVPYLLTAWSSGPGTGPDEDHTAWRTAQEAAGNFVLGGALGGPETATTLRYQGDDVVVSDGPFLDLADFIAGIDVVRCPDLEHAIEIAASHPAARDHVVEVRPFYSGPDEPQG